MNPPYPVLSDEVNISQQSSLLVLDAPLGTKRPLPGDTHPLDVLVKANLIAFENRSLEFTIKNIAFKDPLPTFRPHVLEPFGDNTQ